MDAAVCSKTAAVATGIVAVLALTNCSTSAYRHSADRETYSIISHKTRYVPGMQPGFTIETEADPDFLAGLPVLEDPGEPFGEDADAERGAAVISLEGALNIAVRNSRTYQNQKEQLYLAALDLTLERHQFAPFFTQVAVRRAQSQAAEREPGPTPEVFFEAVDDMAGTPAELVRAYAAVLRSAQASAAGGVVYQDDEFSADGAVAFSIDQLLRGGGEVALSLTADFFRFLTSGGTSITSSRLLATFTQPLLRGAGADVALENLTQAERDALYALREYTRFRKEFIVQIYSDYYTVLQNKDIARNTWRSYLSFLDNLERERALAREGRRTQSDVGRLEQAALNSRRTWVAAVQRYESSLDRFKIALGLPTLAHVVLDDAALARLRALAIEHPAVTPEDAIQVALAARLDLMTEEDRVADAGRKVAVAANALQADLDIVAAAQVDSDPEGNAFDLDFEDMVLDAGFALDLPLDRKAERNAYRAALIAVERAKRNYTLAADTVVLEVRNAARALEEARFAYEIALTSVEVNRRRVHEQELRADVGRGTTIDLVDAQNDLVDAQNSLTTALIQHTVARLAFWRDMGILYVTPEGLWQELDIPAGVEAPL